MKSLIFGLVLIFSIHSANANVCYPDSYGKVAQDALKILAQVKNDEREIYLISGNYLIARSDYIQKTEEIEQKRKQATSRIEFERLDVEMQNVNYDFCFQEVFEAEKKFIELKDRLQNLDTQNINKSVSNLKTWARWCDKERKHGIETELSSMAAELLHFRDTLSKWMIEDINLEIASIDYLKGCRDFIKSISK